MKIDINKDFEEAFPNEVYLGFTLGQCMAAASGMAIAFAAAFLAWHYLKIPIVECTYLAIPLMVPACAAGFFKYQGQSLAVIIRAFFYTRRTEKLSWEAGEYKGRKEPVFSMRRPPGKMPGRKKDRSKKKKRKEG